MNKPCEQGERISAIMELCSEYQREKDPEERENILRTLDEIVRNEPIEMPSQTLDQWDDELEAEDYEYRILRSSNELCSES
jgi:hypothetical protein